MKNFFFYKVKNIGNNFYCKWIFDLNEIDKINNKNLFYCENKNFKKKLYLTANYNEFIFNVIYKKLKKIHKNNLTKREWKILLGRWVKFYVDATFFRYNYLIQSVKKKNIKNYYFKFNNKNNYIPNTISDYIENIDNPERNNFLNWKILNYIKINNKKKNIKIYYKTTNEKKVFNRFSKIYNLKGIKFYIASILNFFLKFFLNKNSPIIVTSYLPKKEELLLQLKNKSLFFWKNFFYIKNFKLISIFNKKKINRNKIIKNNKVKGFKGLLIHLLDDFFPTCFLENFYEMDFFVKKNMLVKKPNFIFTSNEFVFNEFFKYYLVLAIKNKSKYIAGQHGSAYGSLYDQFNTIEEQTSDYFFTWGWKQRKNHVPIGLFSQIGKKKFNKNKVNNKINNLLLVNTNYLHKRNFWDSNEQYLNNFQQQVNFLKSLNFSLFQKIIVRHHPADKKYSDFFYSKYKSINSNIIIDNGDKKIEKYLDDQTLVIFSYLSSGFFELFSRNFNCLSFDCLDKEHYQLNFHKELNKLKKNKIFFENGISASKHINNLLKKKHNIDFNNKNFSKNNSSFIRKYANFDKVNLEQIDKILNR